MKTFSSYTKKGMTLRNRIVMPPMCMYSAEQDGKVTEFHKIHYTARSVGGVGLIIVEATGISPEGRISDRDLGLWDDSHIEGMAGMVESIKKHGSAAAIQLGHGGRKYEGQAKVPVAPSPIPFSEKSRVPHELSTEEIKTVVRQFAEAAERAHKAGFDAVEIHAAHGYLLNEFLSPITNVREDAYGGSVENRTRILKEVLEALHEVWPEDKPVLLRVSASDQVEGGNMGRDMVEIINQVKHLVDIVHVSSGGLTPEAVKSYPGYQVNLSSLIKEECQVDTVAVGLITIIEMVEEIVGNGRGDLVALGRELLRNPHYVLLGAFRHGIDISYPVQYERAFK